MLMMEFDTARLASDLDSLSAAALDALPYGAIKLDRNGTVLRYNRIEAELSGLEPMAAIGRNFFREVAPCAQHDEFYGRFLRGIAAGDLNTLFFYHFTPIGQRVRIHMRLHGDVVWVLVKRLTP